MDIKPWKKIKVRGNVRSGTEKDETREPVVSSIPLCEILLLPAELL